MLNKVLEVVKMQNLWRRKQCLNMIASENVLSPLAEKLYISDFEGRYNEHDEECHYQGTKYAMEIENIVNKIFGEKFSTPFVDCRPIAGAIANLCVYHAFLKPGDVFIAPGLTAGAHVSSTEYGIASVKGLKSISAFFDFERFVLDVDKTALLIEKLNPKLIMLGRSVFLFPEPIKELREIAGDSIIVYDAAHVFGLIYANEFQSPFEEGADIITASTHKTFPGPQGGIILAKADFDEQKWKKIQRAIFPGVISNHHIHRLPALAVTALEMNEFGESYAKQIIKNAKCFAQALYELGFNVLCEEYGFTNSHQILVDVKNLGGGKIVAEKLEKANIITNKIALPWDKDKDATQNPSGIRIGVQELTRWGMTQSEMKEIAEFFKKVLIDNQDPSKVKQEVIEFRKNFQEIKYAFSLEGEIYEV
ncbi:MAG TPA: serine hydroxymethyltransferase [Nanoarchaeota archaeon]|nr:serine hydroxymethyltransferase [Nanoarchaeota archaeon]